MNIKPTRNELIDQVARTIYEQLCERVADLEHDAKEQHRKLRELEEKRSRQRLNVTPCEKAASDIEGKLNAILDEHGLPHVTVTVAAAEADNKVKPVYQFSSTTGRAAKVRPTKRLDKKIAEQLIVWQTVTRDVSEYRAHAKQWNIDDAWPELRTRMRAAIVSKTMQHDDDTASALKAIANRLLNEESLIKAAVG